MEPCVERLQPSLSRSAYWSDAFYHREQAAIFWDQWFCIGRDEEWTQPGSFRVVDVAGESVIVVRGEDGVPRAFVYRTTFSRGGEPTLTRMYAGR